MARQDPDHFSPKLKAKASLYLPSLDQCCWIVAYNMQVVPKSDMALIASRDSIPVALAESKPESFM